MKFHRGNLALPTFVRSCFLALPAVLPFLTFSLLFYCLPPYPAKGDAVVDTWRSETKVPGGKTRA